MKKFVYLFISYQFFYPILFSQDLFQKEDFKKRILWKGEIQGNYQGKKKAKIQVSEKESITLGEIKNSLKEKRYFDILQKYTNKKIGVFEVTEVLEIYDKNNKTQTSKYLEVYGNVNFENGTNSSLVSTNAYIVDYKIEQKYVEPDEFYQGAEIKKGFKLIHPVDKKEMIFIPGGYFKHGQGEFPERDDFNPNFYEPSYNSLVDLSEFYIDKYEVTNSEYYNFLKRTNSSFPKHWKNGKFEKGKENHPVVNLTFREVENYARWVGKRIPTEFEWEKASRGEGIRMIIQKDETVIFEDQSIRYPYGNLFDQVLCNTIESNIHDTISIYDIPLKSASPYGVIGMCGNAPEWTSSFYHSYLNKQVINNIEGKILKVIRGGGYQNTKEEASVSYRLFGGIPNLSSDGRAGFRLVMDTKNK